MWKGMHIFRTANIRMDMFFMLNVCNFVNSSCTSVPQTSKYTFPLQALVSFKKYMPPPLPYFKVNIYPFPLPHFASIFFAYLLSFRWPNYIVTLPRYVSFWLPHLNKPTVLLSDKLDKNSQRTWLIKNVSIVWLRLVQKFQRRIFFFNFIPPFCIFSLAAILVGSRDHRTQFWKGAIQGPFH